MEVLGVFAAALLVLMAGFQISLAWGAPWGGAAYGGRASLENGRLTTRFRTMSGAASILLFGMAYVALVRADVVEGWGPSPPLISGLTWSIAALMTLNTLANLTSPNKVERYLMGSVTGLLAVSMAILAWRGA